ncbi:2-oxoglutarate dehydrogenase, E2 component, dihydrolipoamide succinyltransferase [Candidatus Manganitrophus noduliformans]|uniref:Dihydrolipoamide acetyltransferase component of pyruvate dehydrogenase complex n=1 Tax=Candidatus Manganitrophus noduliformans TaxID=2606439 RepID=A0A7X6DQX6_9BACT|nr:2-oxoglutarate dehydrogenase, E2 component, dihydrolipoamide succinyltransferase [Candidatus Manganitrophus noduliformans]NKE71687.1 2-oxoglutarate dehydrogenase, E2 component, dihydrolipoamide succinyltransferase [Candidatus Manganitrophus noduliformans]
MSTKVIMPQMGESVVEGKVAKWLVREGEQVETDQPIAEISTDKVDVEIPSPGAGTLTKIYVPEGETVSIGAELAVIGDGKEEGKEAAKPPEVQRPPATTPGRPPETERPPTTAPSPEKPAEKSERGEAKREDAEIGRISPLVRKLAEEHRVDLSQVQGTGLGGRITKQDILRYVGEEETQPAEEQRAPASPAPSRPSHEAPKPAAPLPAETLRFKEFKIPRYEPKEGDQVIPFSRLRKMIAEHMVYSKRTAPHVATVAEVDMAKVVRLRKEKKGSIKEQTGADLTYLPFLISAAIQAISDYPTLNAAVVDDSLVIRKEIHMGIAVETEKGLMVPVIRRAHEMSLAGLSRAAAELAEKARKGTLSPDEITGGSFTISNPGREGNLFGTPIIFQPQVGILRMGEIVKRPMVIDVDGNESIAVRPMMYLALSYDHRVIDGATGNAFLHRVKEILEEGRFQL